MVMRTGNNFYELSQSAMRGKSIIFDCIENPTYDDYKENNYETLGCGSSTSSLVTFYSFAVVVGLIFLNLFIAIIL